MGERATELSNSPGSVRLPAWLLVGCLALTFARWIVPTEATPEGETLWIAGLWLLAGAIVAAWCWQAGLSRRADRLDVCVALLIGGHVVSGLVVIATAGDRRAASNCLWEWMSLSACWTVWRILGKFPDARQALQRLMLVTAVTLSAWGLWQYFVWFPALQQQFSPLFDQYHRLAAERGDLTGIHQQLTEAGIAIDPASLKLFENRLRFSRQPFGPFALANTLGGLLAAWCLYFLSLGISDHGSSLRRQAGRIGLLLAPVLVCLYLTNSRTAWGGLLIGGVLAVVLGLRSRVRSPARQFWMFPLATVMLTVCGLGLLLVVMQGQHVVPGPLKSLAYRAEYWMGTLRLLAVTPWLGAGLGQFRDRYLAFKLPESSEEISDPHNLLLDVWANGGLLAVVGLLGVVVVLWSRLNRLSSMNHSTRLPVSPGTGWIVAGGLGVSLVIVGHWAFTGNWDDNLDRIAVFGAVWLVIAGVVSAVWRQALPSNQPAGLLAATALLVHLLGAGGIAMPAVMQLVLLMLVLGSVEAEEDTSATSRSITHRWKSLGGFAGWGMLAACCCWSSVIPVALVRQALANGDYAWNVRHDGNRAETWFQRAQEADSWSAEPWERLANLEYTRALSARPGVDRAVWARTLELAAEAAQRVPQRFANRWQIAEMSAGVARKTGQIQDWRAAAEAYRAAIALAPTHAQGIAETARALRAAGESEHAAEFAVRALHQDELNRKFGHTDRFLTDETVHELETLTEAISGK